MTNATWTLSTRADGYGYFYGTLISGDRRFNINVLPPRTAWQGDVVLLEFEPDPIDWIVYVDGREIARVHRREDVEATTTKLLTNA